MATHLILWHGAHRWAMPPRILPVKAKHVAAHGPGIYFTNNVDTALGYAKGGGSLMRAELDRPRAWLDGATLALADVERFLRETPRLRKRAEVLADARIAAAGGGRVPADVVNDLLTRHGLIVGDVAPALAAFYVRHGIDAALVTWRSNEEDWVVLFNPGLIVRITKLIGDDRAVARNLPRVVR